MIGASFPLWQWFFIVFFRWCFRLLYLATGGLEVHGLDNVPNGALLLSPNHRSLLDPWIMLAATPRPHRYLAARELHSIPVLGQFMGGMGSSPITRGSTDAEAMARVERWLRCGDSVVVFAEGRISPNDEFLPLQPGVVVMSLRHQVPIVPVAICGSNRVLPLGARWFRERCKIVVRFGPPLVPRPLRRGDSIKGAVRDLSERLEEQMRALYGGAGSGSGRSGAGGSSHGNG